MKLIDLDPRWIRAGIAKEVANRITITVRD